MYIVVYVFVCFVHVAQVAHIRYVGVPRMNLLSRMRNRRISNNEIMKSRVIFSEKGEEREVSTKKKKQKWYQLAAGQGSMRRVHCTSIHFYRMTWWKQTATTSKTAQVNQTNQ